MAKTVLMCLSGLGALIVLTLGTWRPGLGGGQAHL